MAKRFLLCAFVLMASGCVIDTTDEKYNQPQDHIDSAAYYGDTPLKDPKNRQIGLALAGGGLKASSFAMGALWALSDENMLWHEGKNDASLSVDAISTVSGGGYAAFYLFSHMIEDSKNHSAGALSDDGIKRYFDDCLPIKLTENFTTDMKDALTKHRAICKQYSKGEAAAYASVVPQKFVRCSQDIFDRDCWFRPNSAEFTGEKYLRKTSLVLATLASTPVAFMTNTVFDWPLNTSPSRQAYIEGLGESFGLYPNASPDFAKKLQIGEFTEDNIKGISCESFSNCKQDALHHYRLDRSGLTFAALRDLYPSGNAGDAPRPPVWFLNATATPSRSVISWMGRDDTDAEFFVFRMSPYAQGANAYGLSDGFEDKIDLIEATGASAAFFDANQRALASYGWKFLFAGLQHIGNVNWGVDVPHREASKNRLAARSLLPFPLYYLDGLLHKKAAYVRLIDGGSGENFGAYPLIIDGYKDVIISDHSQDVDGSMADLCLLHNELLLRRGKFLHVPGLEDWPHNCAANMNRSMKSHVPGRNALLRENVNAPAKGDPAPYYYPVHAWPYPFLAGCVSDSSDAKSCLNPKNTTQRIWITKPAIDYRYFSDTQKTGKHVSHCGEDAYLPCEAAAFLINNINKKNAHGAPIFPQNATHLMTANSSAFMYGAYKSLGRTYMAQLLAALKKTRGAPEYFRDIFTRQANAPIRAAHTKEGLRYHKNKRDVSIKGWTSADRKKIHAENEKARNIGK